LRCRRAIEELKKSKKESYRRAIKEILQRYKRDCRLRKSAVFEWTNQSGGQNGKTAALLSVCSGSGLQPLHFLFERKLFMGAFNGCFL
jgi:hypothetical protein